MIDLTELQKLMDTFAETLTYADGMSFYSPNPEDNARFYFEAFLAWLKERQEQEPWTPRPPEPPSVISPDTLFLLDNGKTATLEGLGLICVEVEGAVKKDKS